MCSLVACWPYLGLFTALLLTGIGLPPLPEEVTVTAAGIAAHQGELLWWVAWPVCVAGVLAADLALYGIGRFWGQAVFRLRWANRALPPERRARLEAGFRRHGLKILLAGRLVPGSRTGVFVLAGVLRYPLARFLLIDSLAAAISVGIVFFGTGLLTGWLTPLLAEGRGWWVVLLVVGVIVGGALFLIRRRRFKQNPGVPTGPTRPVGS